MKKAEYIERYGEEAYKRHNEQCKAINRKRSGVPTERSEEYPKGWVKGHNDDICLKLKSQVSKHYNFTSNIRYFKKKRCVVVDFYTWIEDDCDIECTRKRQLKQVRETLGTRKVILTNGQCLSPKEKRKIYHTEVVAECNYTPTFDIVSKLEGILSTVTYNEENLSLRHLIEGCGYLYDESGLRLSECV